MLPVNTAITTWGEPARRLDDVRDDGSPALDIIAIDNLPSLLPKEASEGFSARPHRPAAGTPRPAPEALEGPWAAAVHLLRPSDAHLEAPQL